MIGLDTNILIRYLTHDDHAQTAAARKILASLTPENPGFITVVVLVETVWVLARFYSFTKEELVVVIESFLRSRDVVLERADLAQLALRSFIASAADFSDCLIERGCREADCQYVVTFDRKAAAAGMRLIDH